MLEASPGVNDRSMAIFIYLRSTSVTCEDDVACFEDAGGSDEAEEDARHEKEVPVPRGDETPCLAVGTTLGDDCARLARDTLPTIHTDPSLVPCDGVGWATGGRGSSRVAIFWFKNLVPLKFSPRNRGRTHERQDDVSTRAYTYLTRRGCDVVAV